MPTHPQRPAARDTRIASVSMLAEDEPANDEPQQISFADLGVDVVAQLPADWEAESQAEAYANTETQSRLIISPDSDAKSLQTALEVFTTQAFETDLTTFEQTDDVSAPLGTWIVYRTELQGRTAAIAGLEVADTMVVAVFIGSADDFIGDLVALLETVESTP